MIAANNPEQPGCPTLQDLRRKANLTSRQVAEAAGVPLRVEYLIEIGGMVTGEDAEKVLTAFSRLTGQEYSLQNVAVHLAQHAARLPDQQPQVRPTVRSQPTLRKVHLLS